MIPIPTNIPWKLVGYGAAALALVGLLAWLYTSIYSAGQANIQKKWDESVRAAEAEARDDTDAIVDGSAIIDLDATTTIGTIETVRTVWRDREIHIAHEIYRDKPGCALPDSLWRSSDQHTRDLAATASIGVADVRPADAAGQR